MARRSPLGRLRRPGGLRALGGVAAQFSQAHGSLALQLLAARTLELPAFGVFAVLLGAIVVATGVMTGLVGDSLTVLDRSRPPIRAALQFWCVVVTAGTFLAGAVVGERTGFLSAGESVLFGLAMAAWVAEDTVRRLLMATFRFWSVVVVDLTHAATAVGVLGVIAATGRVTLGSFLLALLVGQLVAIAAGLALAPAAERAVVGWRGAELRTVAGFGAWRGLQQAIRPASLTIARTLVILAAGRAAMGQLEAARVYMAPALLVVQGVGSVLLAVYAAGRDRPIREAVRRADRAALALVGSSALLGAAGTLCVGWAGPLVSGDAYRIDPLAVAGWATFAASVAAIMPYSSLAAVRGRQIRVVLLRLVDSAVSVGAVAALLWLAGAPASAVPFAIAAGSFLGALLQRRVALAAGDPAAPGGAEAAPAADPVPTLGERAHDGGDR